jgi:DNA-binding HxlR family transcriptional regulator
VADGSAARRTARAAPREDEAPPLGGPADAPRAPGDAAHGAHATAPVGEPTGEHAVAHAFEHAAELDRVIHERLRLAIVSALAVNDVLSFNELKALLQTTDGNLSVHARRLEEAGYVACVKSFEGRVPRTQYRLTAAGRRALTRYLDHMEAIIRATRPR